MNLNKLFFKRSEAEHLLIAKQSSELTINAKYVIIRYVDDPELEEDSWIDYECAGCESKIELQSLIDHILNSSTYSIGCYKIRFKIDDELEATEISQIISKNGRLDFRPFISHIKQEREEKNQKTWY